MDIKAKAAEGITKSAEDEAKTAGGVAKVVEGEAIAAEGEAKDITALVQQQAPVTALGHQRCRRSSGRQINRTVVNHHPSTRVLKALKHTDSWSALRPIIPSRLAHVEVLWRSAS